MTEPDHTGQRLTGRLRYVERREPRNSVRHQAIVNVFVRILQQEWCLIGMDDVCWWEDVPTEKET